MITEEYLKDNLITAYFIDNERQNIEMLLRADDEKGQKVITHIIPFDENNSAYKILNKFIDVDQLHELTYQKLKKEQNEYENTFVAIARKKGLIFNMEKVDTKFFPYMIKAIFEEQDNMDHLFALKLALFEIPEIRDSSNDDAKKLLRKSTNKLDVIKAALECVE